MNGVEKIAFFIYAVIGSLSSVLWFSPNVLGYFLATKGHTQGPREVALNTDERREHKMLKSHYPACNPLCLVQFQREFC